MVTSARVRELLELHGTCQPQEASERSGDIPLPDPIAEFYQHVGPMNITIEGYGNPTFIPRLSELWNRQAGYRWNGLTGETTEDWHDDWTVVADEGADPYIYCNGKILFAQHGAGVWEPDEIYSDLNTMAACLATLGAVVLNAGDELTDDDCYIRPEFRAHPARIRASDSVTGRRRYAARSTPASRYDNCFGFVLISKYFGNWDTACGERGIRGGAGLVMNIASTGARPAGGGGLPLEVPVYRDDLFA